MGDLSLNYEVLPYQRGNQKARDELPVASFFSLKNKSTEDSAGAKRIELRWKVPGLSNSTQKSGSNSREVSKVTPYAHGFRSF